MSDTAAMIQAVKDHAVKHYEDGGWDVIVECYDDEQIADLLSATDTETKRTRSGEWKYLTWGPARTPGGAIKKVARMVVSVYADRQADAKNSAF